MRRCVPRLCYLKWKTMYITSQHLTSRHVTSRHVTSHHNIYIYIYTTTLLLTYNALGKSIASYAAPVWSTNASDSSYKKIQTTQNAALRTAIGVHKMASIDHLHQESLTLKVKDHSDMLSAQYPVNCLEEDHVFHGITTQEPSHKPMKETLHSRHPSIGTSRKESPRNLHTHGRFGY